MEDNYINDFIKTNHRKIHDEARKRKIEFMKGYAPQDIPIEEDFSYWFGVVAVELALKEIAGVST